MTDTELAKYLNLNEQEAAIIIPQLTPHRRALYDRMLQVEQEVELYARGLGPRPQGVLLDFDRRRA